MPPAGCADTRHLAGLRSDIVHDVIGATRVAAYASGNPVEPQSVPRLPRDIVIGARGISTHADCAYQDLRRVVERQTTAEYVHTSDFSSDHRVVRLAVICGIAS